jgi:hypothetical protein
LKVIAFHSEPSSALVRRVESLRMHTERMAASTAVSIATVAILWWCWVSFL